MLRALILIALGIGAVQATPLEPLDNAELISVLTGFEVLADSQQLSDDPAWVRVLRVIEDGECGGTPQSCPKSRLYVAVSEYGEYRAANVFRLPIQYEWEFVAWKSIPDYLAPGEYVELELSYKVPSSTPDKGWWSERTVVLKVNPAEALLVRGAPSN